MEQVAVNEKFEENMIKEKCAKEELTILASNLHHLVSTNCQPGIYKAPYAKQQPKVFDIDLEVHLKTAYRMKSKKKKSNDGFRVRSTSYYK